MRGLIVGIPVTILCMVPYVLLLVLPAYNAWKLQPKQLPDYASAIGPIVVGLLCFVVGVSFFVGLAVAFGAILSAYAKRVVSQTSN